MLGTDPEVFVLDSGGRARSAHHFFPNAAEKIAVGKKTKIFRDGYALELNVAPAHQPFCLGVSLGAGFTKAQELIGKAHRLVAVSAVEMDPRELDGAPEDLQTLGCHPSYCAYDLRIKRPDVDARKLRFRSGGCHIHFSGKDGSPVPFLVDKKLIPLAVRILDYYWGLPLTFITASPAVFKRRELYGQAGEFRIQKYPDGKEGLEYRTPGSEMLQDAEVFQLGMTITRHILGNFKSYSEDWDGVLEKQTRLAIDTGEFLAEFFNGTLPGPHLPGVMTKNLLEGMRKKHLAAKSTAPFSRGTAIWSHS